MWSQFLLCLDLFKMKSLVVLTLVYFVIAIIVAIKDRRFQFSSINNSFDYALVPLYLGICVVALVALVQPEWTSLLPTVWGILDVMMLSLIADKARALGLPFPNIPWTGTLPK
jgi:uncharacterized membrane protein YdcZ (DUF606 family)